MGQCLKTMLYWGDREKPIRAMSGEFKDKAKV